MAEPLCAQTCPNINESPTVPCGDGAGYFVQIPDAKCEKNVACNKIDSTNARSVNELPEDCFILRIGKRGCDGCVEREQLELELRAPPPKFRETKEIQYDPADCAPEEGAAPKGGKRKSKGGKGKKGKKGKKK